MKLKILLALLLVFIIQICALPVAEPEAKPNPYVSFGWGPWYWGWWPTYSSRVVYYGDVAPYDVRARVVVNTA